MSTDYECADYVMAGLAAILIGIFFVLFSPILLPLYLLGRVTAWLWPDVMDLVT